jgi:WYL domain-containing protein
MRSVLPVMAAGRGAPVVSIGDRHIRFAIANRRLIRFIYGSTSRVAEPHDYGIQHGRVRLLVYQRRAAPFSRGWRMLDVAKITRLEVLDETFAGSRRESHQHHFTWDQLFARVE